MLKTVLLQKIKPYRRVNKKGFTLMEMLIVVAIIAILIAVAIPVFSAQFHKARVATDWANLRSFYADIQTDYMTTGEQNPKVPVGWHTNPAYDWHSVTFLNGQKVKMKAGFCAVSFTKDVGYSIEYECNDGHPACHLSLPAQ